MLTIITLINKSYSGFLRVTDPDPGNLILRLGPNYQWPGCLQVQDGPTDFALWSLTLLCPAHWIKHLQFPHSPQLCQKLIYYLESMAGYRAGK